MRYRVSHRTVYEYADPVAFCQNQAHMTPREHASQRVASVRMTVSPRPAVLTNRLDFYGNTATFFAVQEPHVLLEVDVVSEVAVSAAPIPGNTPRWDTVGPLLAGDLSTAGLEASEFLHPSPHVQVGADLREYAAPSFPKGRPLLEAALDLNARIFRDFKYKPLATTVSTPVREVLRTREGVCQDFAHLMIACLRSVGLPARYVSGYIRTTPRAGQRRLVGADASHAWASVYCPGSGWIDFDPTNNKIPTDEHITVAWGRDYADVSPIRGVLLGGSGQTLKVSVDVQPMEANGAA